MSMTKEQIRQELINHGIQVPAGNVKKDEYVKLFEEHVRPMHKVTSNFSTDEEDDDIPIPNVAKVENNSTNDGDKSDSVEVLQVAEMSDSVLYEFLVKAGKGPGPIIGTTRGMYEKLAVSVMKEKPDLLSPNPATNGHENGKDEGGYSDTEDDDEAIETASRASRTSSKITSSSKSPIVETPPNDSPPSKSGRAAHRKSPDTPFVFRGSALKDQSAFLKRLRGRNEDGEVPYRRPVETDGSVEKESTGPKVRFTEPSNFIRKPRQQWSGVAVGAMTAIAVAIIGLGAYYVISLNRVEGEPRDELDELLESIN